MAIDVSGRIVLIWNAFPNETIASSGNYSDGTAPSVCENVFFNSDFSYLDTTMPKSLSGLSSGVRVTYSRGIFKRNTGKQKSSVRPVNHTAEDAARTRANMARQKAGRDLFRSR
jgi:hypothetical protein